MRKKMIALTAVPLLLLAACSGEATPAETSIPATTVSAQPADASAQAESAPTDDVPQGEASPATEQTAGTTPAGEQRESSANGCSATDDDLVITDGEVCKLTDATVGGNIEVERGGTLIATGVTVDGDVQGDGHAAITFVDGSVDGNIQLEEGGTATVTGTRVDGDLQSEDNFGAQEFSGNTVDGNLQCEGNQPAPTGGGNVVAGDSEDQCAALA